MRPMRHELEGHKNYRQIYKGESVRGQENKKKERVMKEAYGHRMIAAKSKRHRSS
jgi:hypothetical protein